MNQSYLGMSERKSTEHSEWAKLLHDRTIRHFKDEDRATDADSGKELPDFYKDRRTKFEKDVGKVIFSTPFRRLQDKAQVFPLEPMDGIRTRASHSAEVANVARDLARTVARELQKRGEFGEEEAEAFATIANVCGHLHDFGNPPFGHAGEDAIKMWFDKQEPDFWNRFNVSEDLQKDFRCFDGNAQTLRLVSGLQVLADLNGLNLTAGTFSALVKQAGCAGWGWRPASWTRRKSSISKPRPSALVWTLCAIGILRLSTQLWTEITARNSSMIPKPPHCTIA